MSAFWMTSNDNVWKVCSTSRNEEERYPLIWEGRARTNQSAFRSVRKGDIIYRYFTDGKVRWFVSKKLSRKSFNFGETALYAVKKNDRAALFAAVGISEYELTEDHGERRGTGETGLSASEKYALVDETRRACPKKTHAETEDKWQRDDRCVKTAITHAKFKCERDGRHVTFKRENGNVYLEGHHLVGMRHQGLFKRVSLDNPANIVALCPNCHRLMHFGTRMERRKALKAFYKARKDRLAKAGIKIGEERFIELGLS